jgi:dTDP-N-acetylfucosamine:lipid II N-acetylfucosaminyltransferase
LASIFNNFFSFLVELNPIKKKILHIVEDEKFIDFAFREFNQTAPGIHVFVLIGSEIELKFVKQANIYFLHPKIFWTFSKVAQMFFKVVVFHSLNGDYLFNVLGRFSKGVKVVWMSWGFDLIALLEINRDFLKPLTQIFLPETSQIKTFSSSIEYKNSFQFSPPVQSVLSRIDFISTVIQDEYNYLENSAYSPVPKFMAWNYFTIEDDIISKFSDIQIKGNNLLFGNSANIWNNHLDGFLDIEKFGFNFQKIVCPLSYGDMQYREAVIDLGNSKFGNRFVPVIGYMDYNDYVTQLLSCRYFFMNSKRQLGLGNLLLMLYLGANIILDKSNPTYDYFIRNGIKVFTIENAIRSEFSDIDLIETRQNLIRIWGKDEIRKKTNTLLDKVYYS